MRFESGFEVVGQMPPFDEAVIREELNVHLMERSRALTEAGPVVQAFVAALPTDWDDVEVLVRVKLAWLRAGWRPARPRWHCDQVRMRPDGEPDYVAGSYPGKHTIAAVVGGCSLTRFVVGGFELPEYGPGERTAALVHQEIERRIAAGALAVTSIEEGALVRFGAGDFHDVAPATRDGWRMFLRATVRQPQQAPSTDPLAWRTMVNSYHPETAAEMLLYAPYL